MTLGQKIKEIRKRLGLSQEQLADILNVSRQAITKWENDGGLPDVSNLAKLAKVFNISVDYLLDHDYQLPALSLKKELDKSKYKNKLSSYEEILKEYFENDDIYILTREKNMNTVEKIIDFVVGGSSPEMIFPISSADSLSDLSPYYYVERNNVKLLVNIKNYVLEIIELPQNTDSKKFLYGQNKFKNCGKLKLKNKKQE